LKEVFRQRSTGAVEEVESVEKADTRQPKGAHNKWQQKANRLRNVAAGNELPLPHFWQMYCVSAIAEHEVPDRRIQVGSAAPRSLAKGMSYGI
jgi:hypothetical protein